MSRFFKGGSESDTETSSSSEEFSDKESLVSSDVEESIASSQEDEEAPAKPTAAGIARFMRGAESEDEESDEDVKRVVKSSRDKKVDEMRVLVKLLNNAKKINDWVALQNEYDKLSKAIVKAAAIFSRERIPRFYIRSLVQLEDFIASTLKNKELVKKMNPSTAKAFNAMKQKIKKQCKLYEKDVIGFRAKPVTEEESASEAERLADELEEEIPTKTVKFQEKIVEDDASFTVVGKGGKPVDVIAKENVMKKLVELLEQRGKKSTDKIALMENMNNLLKIAGSDYQSLRVLMALIPSRFDYTSTSAGYTPIDIWKMALQETNQVFDILNKYPNATIGYLDEELDDNEVLNEKTFLNQEPIRIPGHLGSFIDRLDDEFTKSLQNMDPHTSEYIERLVDETQLYALIVRAQVYFESKQNMQDLVDTMTMRRVEHVYYKSDELIRRTEESVKQQFLKDSVQDSDQLVPRLCTGLYKTPIDRVRTRALLCHVYHLALHDQFQEARDMILMSHLQETISMTDVSTQILFNRSMVQTGLAAFRCGLIKEACTALHEISSSGRIRELLAQGIQVQRYTDKSAEQEKLEKQRQLPFHTHINLELVECVYLTSAMLLEIPNIALGEHGKKVISKYFRRMLDYSEKSSFNGPPENAKDCIMAASKSMAMGDCDRAVELILSIKIWNILPRAEHIKSMLASKIKQETCHAYVLSFARYYDNIGVSNLAKMFSLDEQVITEILSKMILNDELNARLNIEADKSTFMMMDRQSAEQEFELIAAAYADKLLNMTETNEKSNEAKMSLLNLQKSRARSLRIK